MSRPRIGIRCGNMRVKALVLAAALIPLLFLPLVPGTASAQEPYSYLAFHSDITVNADGTVLVRDKVAYTFSQGGEWVGIFVPSDYGRMSSARVLDASGEPLAEGDWDCEADENGFSLWARNAAGAASSTFIYEYALSGSLSSKGDLVGLEWSAVPSNRGSPIPESSLTFRFPRDVDPLQVELEVSTDNYSGKVVKNFVSTNMLVVEVNGLEDDSTYSFSCYWPSSLMAEGFANRDGEEAPEAISPQSKYWEYERFDVDIQVNEDSSLSVRETLVADFHGSFTFLTRYLSAQEKSFDEGRTCGRVNIRDVAVYDLEGNPYDPAMWNMESDSDGTTVRMEFQATDEARGWIISYQVSGVVIFAPDYDRLYWNAVPDDRGVPIRSSRISVFLPKGAPLHMVGTELYIDPINPPGSYESGTEGGALWWEAKDVPPYTTFTIDISFPKGLVRKPWQYGSACAIAVIAFCAALFAGTLAFMLLRWWRRGRDVGKVERAVVRYDPPAGLKPAMLAMLMRERTRAEDIAPTIVDLACRGKLSISEEESRGLIRVKKFAFQRLDRDGSDLLPYEKRIMDGLFSKGETVTEDDLKDRFHVHVQDILEGIKDEVMSRRLFLGEPRKVRATYYLVGALTAAIPCLAAFLLHLKYDLGWLALIPAGFVAAGACIMVIGTFMPRRSPEGSRAYGEALGYRDFLATAEKPELEYMTPENFQANLPYAMALGVAGNWAGKFKDIYMEPPQWYRGPVTSFGAVYLASSLTHMSGNLDRTLTSSPSRSGGSYGGGGFGDGFSGGGFGGGGTSAG